MLQGQRPAVVPRGRAAFAPRPAAAAATTAQPAARLRPAAATAAPAAPASASSSSSSSSSRTAPHPEATWKAWVGCLPSWPGSSTLDKKQPNTTDRAALAKAVASAAASYTPRPSLKVPSLDDLGADVPANLHKRLELVAKVQLAAHLGVGLEALRATVEEYTTSDVNAALSVAGATTTGRKAVLSLVATETERQATWSRLEGLILHWAVTRKAPPNEKWELPARGWSTLPDTTVDAGGAWSTAMEKHPLPAPRAAGGGGTAPPQAMFTAVVEVPLEGNLSDGGGLIFVLKSGGTGQKTRWLKDAATAKDFYVGLHDLKSNA